MFDYIQKFNKLPLEVREKISNPKMTAVIEELERKYGVELVKTIMQVMTRDVSLDYLGLYFMEEFGLSGEAADRLVQDLYKYVFSAVADYLGIEPIEASEEEKTTETKPEKKQESETLPKQQIGDQLVVDVSKAQIDVKTLASHQPQAGQKQTAEDNASSQSADQLQLAQAQAQSKKTLKTDKQSAPSQAEEFKVKAQGQDVPVKIAAQKKGKPAAQTPSLGQLSASQTQASQTKSRPQESEKIIDDIISQIGIIFSSQQAKQRLRQVIRTYLRGLRKRPEVRIILTKAYEQGGLGLSNQDADEILNLADKAYNSFMAALARESSAGYPESHILPSKIKIEHPLPAVSYQENKDKKQLDKVIVEGERDIPYDFQKLADKPAKKKPGKDEQVDKKSLVKSGSQSPKPETAPEEKSKGAAASLKLHGEDKLSDQILSAHKQELDKDSSKDKPAKGEQVQTVSSQPVVTARQKRPTAASAKPRLDDVTYKPKVMGPIDELRQMTLLDFRRLNPDPTRATQKIKEKIELIGEEQYAKRIEAIKAWRQSPVNKMYAKIGHQSIAKGEPVEKIIAAEKQAGRDCLTISEFEAIMDLNKELRF